jgi:tetratricopeptide (TPR) repeat protein
LKEVARRGLELVQRRTAVREHPDDVQRVLDLAQAYARYQDLHEAIRTLEARARERNEPQVLEALTALLLQARMTERAQGEAERLVALRPEDAAAHYYLMDASLRLGQLALAEREFEASKRLDDKVFSLWFSGARLYRLLGREEECTAALRKALALGGMQVLELGRADPVLGGSPSLETVARDYLGAPAPAGSP